MFIKTEELIESIENQVAKEGMSEEEITERVNFVIHKMTQLDPFYELIDEIMVHYGGDSDGKI